MTIGEKISVRRKKLGLTLEDVGKAVGVGKSTVKKWESGFIANMRRDKIAALAKVLQMNPSEFIGPDDESFEKGCEKKDALTKKFTIAERLSYIMKERGIKQVDILEACQPFCEKYNVSLRKNDLSQYVSGKVEPKQEKLSILGMALNVNEVWLMGYDVPAERNDLVNCEEKAPKEAAVCEIFEQCYGKEAFQAVQLFLQLDTLDRGRIIGSMETMLDNEKYSAQKELSNERAM